MLKNHKATLSNLFCFAFLLFFLSSFAIIILFRGIPFYNVLFADGNDTFMDFFNSLAHSTYADPYKNGVIYPPLNYLYLHFLAILLPREILNLDAFAIRMSQIGLFVFFIFTFFSLGGTLYVIYRNKAGTEFEKVFFTCLCLFSSGFLYQIVRANVIILSLLFLMCFIFGKDSKNRTIRELALICLAIAAAIKIYPALFGLILIKEKRYSEGLRAAIYGVIVFFVPFFFTGGLIHGFSLMISNLRNLSESTSGLGFGYSVNIGNTIKLVLAYMGINPSVSHLTAGIASNSLLVLDLFSFFFLKESWKVCGLLASLMILYPSTSYQYTLIFMIIPLMFFLDKGGKAKPVDYIYAALFLFMLAPIFLPNNVIFKKLIYEYPVTIAVFVESLAIVGMCGLFIVDGLAGTIRYAQHLIARKASSQPLL